TSSSVTAAWTLWWTRSTSDHRETEKATLPVQRGLLFCGCSRAALGHHVLHTASHVGSVDQTTIPSHSTGERRRHRELDGPAAGRPADAHVRCQSATRRFGELDGVVVGHHRAFRDELERMASRDGIVELVAPALHEGEHRVAVHA